LALLDRVDQPGGLLLPVSPRPFVSGVPASASQHARQQAGCPVRLAMHRAEREDEVPPCATEIQFASLHTLILTYPAETGNVHLTCFVIDPCPLWLYVSPSVQFITHPGWTDQADAIAMKMRVQMSF
jgi:hypothetical protein